MRDKLKMGGRWYLKCTAPDGTVKWEAESHNTVVNAGLEHILDILFVSATSQVDPWYVGLTDASPTIASTDTVASHGGWVEVTAYSATTRSAYVDVRSDRQVSNTASKASFAISSTVTVGGAFLASSSTGTTGTLLCVAAFSGSDRSAVSGDTVEATYTFSAATS
jgi:uncharacterized membrane protein